MKGLLWKKKKGSTRATHTKLSGRWENVIGCKENGKCYHEFAHPFFQDAVSKWKVLRRAVHVVGKL